MAEELRFDPDVVDSANKRVRGSTDQFSSMLDMLLNKCKQHDGCWGNDEFGKAFAKSYLPSQSTMCSNGVQMVLGLSTFSANLDQGVIALEQTDQNNADKM